MTKKPGHKPGLPSRDDLLVYIRENPDVSSRRDLMRAFGLKPSDKAALKDLLREIKPHKQRGSRGDKLPHRLPSTLIVEVFDVDAEEGEALAHPVDPEFGRPILHLRGETPLGIGERALVRVEGKRRGRFAAHVLRRMERAPERVLAVYRPAPDGDRLQPTSRKVRTEFIVGPGQQGGAKSGELVLAEVLPQRRLGLPTAKIIEVLGSINAPRAASLVAIHAHEIPTEFPSDALTQAERARPAPMGEREDLRSLPLVTIDGEDARDFDDAVFAEPDTDAANPGGFHLIVAIADVAWYVRPGDALDRASADRGNSVYFPDRVVPMLPERLSNDLCSLRPNEDRPTLAVHMWIDAHGRKRRHRFTRAMIHSTARLTYDQAQNSADGRSHGAPPALQKTTIEPLYAAYRALANARRKRGTLDLDLEERKVVLDSQGRIERVTVRPRYDSHRLIEEFMILANVCAAESLEERRLPCMYRVHEDPDPARLESLREVLDGLGYRLTKGQVMQPKHFTRILDWAANTPYRHLVNDLVLRSQAQAVYSPDNRGHFGLALQRYAHFTSPIRRYSDLLVHRALIHGFAFGEGGLLDGGKTVDFHAVGDHISMTERRAAAAERDALARYVAAWMADKIGAEFSGRVSGVTKFGLFVAIDNLGADGLIPIRSLGGDYYQHDAVRHRLVGQRTRRSFTLGDSVAVRLVDAAPLTGGLTFELLGGGMRAGRPLRDRERAAKGHRERMQRGRRRR
ncbi:MAG: ribonuclease R [Alphaproteobacteria bacterium]|nr:ribonuclease R [Alphaproteobacteria bacterium]